MTAQFLPWYIGLLIALALTVAASAAFDLSRMADAAAWGSGLGPRLPRRSWWATAAITLAMFAGEAVAWTRWL